jgi:hypothetical protein
MVFITVVGVAILLITVSMFDLILVTSSAVNAASTHP